MSNFLENERLCTSGVSRRQPCLPSNRDISTTRTRECASSKIGPEAYMTMRPSDAYVNLPPAVEVDTVEEARATLARWEVWNVGLQQQLEADPQILPPHSDRGSEERQSTVPRNRNTVFNNPVDLAKEESLPLPSTTPAPFKVAYRTTAATERRKVCRQSTRSSRALLLKRALGLEGKPLGRAGYSEGLKERRMDNDYLSTIKTARGLAVGDDVERGAETEDANHDEIYDVDVVSETGSQERADNEVQNKRLHSVANRLRRQLCFTESADGLNVTSKSKSRLHSCPRSYGAWPKPPTHLPQKLGACEAERQGSSSVPIITSRSSPEDEALSTSHVLPVYIDNQKKEEDEDVTMRPVCAIEKRTSDPTASFSPLYGQFPEAKATMHSSEGVQIAVCSSAHGDVEMQKDLQKNSENEENSDGDKERECAGILKDSEEKKGSNDSRKGSERGEDDEEYIQQSIKEEEDEEDLVMQKGEEEEYFQRPTEEYQKGEDEVLNATNGDQEEEDLQRSMEENEEQEDDVLDDTNEDQEEEDLQGPVEEHGEEEEEIVKGTSENQEEEDFQRSLGENEEAEEKVVSGANGDQEGEDVQRLTEDHGEEEGEVVNDTDEEEGDLQGPMEENEEHEDDVLDDTNEDQEEEALQVPLEEHGEEEEEIVNGTSENQEEEDLQRSLGENEEAEEKVVSGANGDQEEEDVQRLTEDHGEEEGEVINDANEVQEEEDLQGPMEDHEKEEDVLDDISESHEEEDFQRSVEEHGEEEEEVLHDTSESQEEEDLQRLTEDHGEEEEKVVNGANELQEEGDLQEPVEENEKHEDEVLNSTNGDQEEVDLKMSLEEHEDEVGKDNFKVSKEGQREEEKDMAEEEEEIKSAIGSKPNGGTMLLKSVTDIPLSERYTLEILTDCAINCPPAERMASEEERNIENKTSYVLSDSNISTFSLARHSCDNVLVDDDSKAKDDAEGDIAKVVPRRVGVSALDSVKCLNSNSNTHYEGMDLSALYIPASSAESFMDTNRAPDPLLEVINTMQDILTDEYTNRLNVLYNERTARDALWLFQSLFDRNRASSASRREIEVSTEATKTTEHLRNALDDAQTTLRFRNHALESTQNELEAHKKEANAACEAFAAREALLRAELDDRMAVLEATREAASTSEAAALRERDAALHSLEALEVRFASLSRDAVSAASGESRQAQLTARLAAALRVAESRTAVANTRAALLASEVTAAEERVNRLRGQRAALVDEVFRKDNLEKTALGFMLWTMRRASVLQLETRQLKHEAQERRRELRLWQNHVCPIRTSLVSRDSVVSSTSNERRSGKSPLLYDQGSIGEVVRERDELREALSGSVAAYEELLAELIVMRNRTEQ